MAVSEALFLSKCGLFRKGGGLCAIILGGWGWRGKYLDGWGWGWVSGSGWGLIRFSGGALFHNAENKLTSLARYYIKI